MASVNFAKTLRLGILSMVISTLIGSTRVAASTVIDFDTGTLGQVVGAIPHTEEGFTVGGGGSDAFLAGIPDRIVNYGNDANALPVFNTDGALFDLLSIAVVDLDDDAGTFRVSASTGATYDFSAADVGQTVSFSNLPGFQDLTSFQFEYDGPVVLNDDFISFNDIHVLVPAPEPSTFVLAILGIPLLGMSRRRRR